MLCAIQYHLHNFKNVTNTCLRVLLLEACNFTKRITPSWMFFSHFLNHTNGTKSPKASHIKRSIKQQELEKKLKTVTKFFFFAIKFFKLPFTLNTSCTSKSPITKKFFNIFMQKKFCFIRKHNGLRKKQVLYKDIGISDRPKLYLLHHMMVHSCGQFL